MAGTGLAVLALAAYSNSFSGEFVLDDQSSIVANPSLRRIWPPWAPLAAAAGGTRGRPFANLTFALNHALGGTSVGGYHVFNLIIHIAAGCLLFGIMRRTFASPPLAGRFAAAAWPLAFAVSALWLVHPLTTEAVAYLSQRTECLMGLAYLSTLYCMIRGAKSEARAGRWYALAAASCLLGMASKEVMVTAPVIIFLYDRTFLAGSFAGAWRLRWRAYLGLAGGWALLGFLMGGIGERGAGLGLGVGAGSYALAECRAVVHYLGLAFWPRPLVFDYGPALDPWGSPAAPCAVTVLAGVALAALLLRFWPPVGFALAWIIGVLAPTSSFVPIALQPVAEHRMYLPLIAVVGLAVAAGYRLLGRRSALVLAACGLLLVWTTHRRNEDYRTAVSLWRDTVAKSPLNARAHTNLGNALLAAGQAAAGMDELAQALRISPDDPEANLDLGVALGRGGDLARALPAVQKAVSLAPSMAEGHFDLAWLSNCSGRTAEALAEYERALVLRPAYYDAQCNIADLLVGTGRYAEAIAHYEAALELGGPNPELYFNLAYARVRTGSLGEAVADYRRALALKPDFVAARRNLELLEKARPGR
jgi:Tfp pilus assembly protein PilF